MKNLLKRLWSDERGALAFEWVLLTSLLTIGVVGGVAATRDAIIDEFGDVSQAMIALDQSYRIDYPIFVGIHYPTASSASNSEFIDASLYLDCDRHTQPTGQKTEVDVES